MVRSCYLVLVSASVVVAQQYGGTGAYEAELQRRQMEYLQQQRLRQAQQAQGSNDYYMQQQAAEQARARQQAQAQAQARAKLQQQLMYEAQMRQAQQNAAGAGTGGYGKKPMGQKEKKKLEAERKKKQEAQLKAQKKAQAARQAAFKKAQRSASKHGAQVSAKQRGGGGNPLGFLLSVKGAALVGGVGYLWIAQRPLFLAITAKLVRYPLMLLSFLTRTVWNVGLKPIIRKLLVLRSGTSAGGELPGGTY